MVDYLRELKSGVVSEFVYSIIVCGISLILIKYLITGSIETKLMLLQILAISAFSISVPIVSGATWKTIG